MMDKVTVDELKDVFKLIKYFKELYRALNKRGYPHLHLLGQDDGVLVFFAPNDESSLIYTKITSDNEFIKFIQNNKIKTLIHIDDINELSKLRRKDCIKYEYDDKEFEIKFIIDEKDNTTKSFIVKDMSDFEDFDKFENLLNVLKSEMDTEKKLSLDILNDNVMFLYLDEDNNPTLNKTEDKLIEIPVKFLMSTQKGEFELFIKYGKRNQNGSRKVNVITRSEEFEVCQIFKTI